MRPPRDEERLTSDAPHDDRNNDTLGRALWGPQCPPLPPLPPFLPRVRVFAKLRPVAGPAQSLESPTFFPDRFQVCLSVCLTLLLSLCASGFRFPLHSSFLGIQNLNGSLRIICDGLSANENPFASVKRAAEAEFCSLNGSETASFQFQASRSDTQIREIDGGTICAFLQY